MMDQKNTDLFRGRGTTYLQVSDILAQASTLHRHIQQRITALEIDDPRLTLLASQFARREARLSALMAPREEATDPRLSVWMKSVPEVDLQTPLDEAFAGPIESPDALVSALHAAESELLELLEQLSTLAPTQGTRDLFAALAEREREAERVHQRERLSAYDL